MTGGELDRAYNWYLISNRLADTKDMRYAFAYGAMTVISAVASAPLGDEISVVASLNKEMPTFGNFLVERS